MRLQQFPIDIVELRRQRAAGDVVPGVAIRMVLPCDAALGVRVAPRRTLHGRRSAAVASTLKAEAGLIRFLMPTASADDVERVRGDVRILNMVLHHAVDVTSHNQVEMELLHQLEDAWLSSALHKRIMVQQNPPIIRILLMDFRECPAEPILQTAHV